MSRLKKTVISFCMISMPLLLQAIPVKEKMKSHLDIISNIFDAGYAPSQWKEQYFGWSLSQAIDEAKEKIDASPDISVKKFQRIVQDFFVSMHDIHVTARFHSTEKATLPFLVKGIDGKYFISYINDEMLSSSVYRIDIGDELVSFDGKATHEVVLKLQEELMSTTEEGTDRSITEMFLTDRNGAYAHEVPIDSVMIGIRKSGQQKINYYQLSWDYEPELISNHYKIKPLQKGKEQKEKKNVFDPHHLKPMMISSYNDFFANLASKRKKCDVRPGSRKSFIPTLGKKWWTSDPDSTFHAYLYENEAGNLIGYIRIPDYSGSTDEVLEFAEIINFFEERSDALVIDQVNNPGGSLFYMYALAGMLTDQPLHTPKHHIALTQEYVALAIYSIPYFEKIADDEEAKMILGDLFHGHPVTHQMTKFFLKYFRFIVSEWEAGRTFSEATHLYGFDQINPNPYGFYSKPILLLVNELSISCGDFFPAILQDNKRAFIMGNRTSGAGGCVLVTHFPNLFGLSHFSYTTSFAERLSKDPIENLGVTPDIIYKISEQDLQSSYLPYKKEINQTILDILYRERG